MKNNLQFPSWQPGRDGRPRLGVLTNPLSGGNRKRGGEVRQLLVRHPEIVQREAGTLEEMNAALEEFARREVGLLVINGGDGTVQAVLSTLGHRAAAGALPAIALLEAGTTSMLARDVGLTGLPDQALQRLFNALAGGLDGGAIHSRPVLKVATPAHPEGLCGMFFGAGAICRGIELFHGSLNPNGRRGEAMMGVTLARMLLDLALGRRGSLPPTPMAIAIDDEPSQSADRLLVLASTLERLFLGLRPYWGTENGPIHFTALADRPPRLLRSLPWLLRGRPRAHAIPSNGYLSRNAAEIRLDYQGPFTLDGELFHHDGETPLVLGTAGPFRFLRL